MSRGGLLTLICWVQLDVHRINKIQKLILSHIGLEKLAWNEPKGTKKYLSLKSHIYTPFWLPHTIIYYGIEWHDKETFCHTEKEPISQHKGY